MAADAHGALASDADTVLVVGLVADVCREKDCWMVAVAVAAVHELLERCDAAVVVLGLPGGLAVVAEEVALETSLEVGCGLGVAELAGVPWVCVRMHFQGAECEVVHVETRELCGAFGVLFVVSVVIIVVFVQVPEEAVTGLAKAHDVHVGEDLGDRVENVGRQCCEGASPLILEHSLDDLVIFYFVLRLR